MALDPISAVLDIGGKILDKIFPDPIEKAKAQAALAQLEQTGELAKIAAAAQVVSDEAKSQHWLTSSWRPITMLTFVAIIANNYIVAPYLQAMFHIGLTLEIPPDMWELLKLGLGGYVVGRSIEKVASSVKR